MQKFDIVHFPHSCVCARPTLRYPFINSSGNFLAPMFGFFKNLIKVLAISKRLKSYVLCVKTPCKISEP